MASTTGDGRLLGFAKEIFAGEIDVKYLCGSCMLVLRTPIQSFCGHRFCKLCIEALLKDNENSEVKCPLCVEENTENEYSVLRLDQTFPDNAIKREFANMKAQCLNTGCSWSGPFKEYEAHEKGCAFKQFICECGALVSRGELEKHMAEDCPNRKVNCPFCDNIITINQQQAHNEVCPNRPAECELCGMNNIPLHQLKIHQDPEHGDCPVPRVYCPFGCNEVVERDKLREHLDGNLPRHVEAMYEKLQLLENQLGETPMKDKLTSLESQISKLDERMKTMSAQVDAGYASDHNSLPEANVEADATPLARRGAAAANAIAEPYKPNEPRSELEEMKAKVVLLEKKVGVWESIVSVLSREIEKCSKQAENIEGQRRGHREMVDTLQNKVRSLERMLALKDVAMADQDSRLLALETTSFDGVLLWKINEYAKKRHDAVTGKTTSLYSPSFYTTRNGYRMCARVYLNGDGMGKSTHISLFFVIQRGQYDALLQWPFRMKVTMMVLDQNNREHVIDAFRPDATSSSFKRPTSEMNIASGCPLFMTLAQLEGAANAYVKDDSMFIKLVVDTSDLDTSPTNSK